MRNVLTTAALVAAVALVGCNQSEKGGKTSDSTPSSSTFRLKAPVTSTTVKQGTSEMVKLSVDRGKTFKETVTLSVEEPSGIKVEVPGKIAASDAESFEAKVTVGKDAAVGDHTVKVSGKPETGNAVSVDFKVKVEAAAAKDK